MNAYGMTPESFRSYNRWHLIVALILAAALLLLPLLFGIGPNSWRNCCAAETATTAAAPAAPVAPVPEPAPAPAPAPEPAQVAAPAAEAPPTATVYFAVNRFEVPATTNDTLSAIVAYLRANPNAKAVLSGFHDPQGNLAANQELALNRARAVRAALGLSGIPEERVVMSRPQETTGTGSNQEARRVEVSVQP